MNDVPDDQTDDRRTATDETPTNRDVPQDAEWEVVTQVHCDPSDGLTTTIIYAVAETEGVSPGDIKQPPLYEVIDTAALDAALFDSETGARTEQCSTEFMYRGHRITVQSDGWVLVHDKVGQ